jgi:hypothetical protein
MIDNHESYEEEITAAEIGLGPLYNWVFHFNVYTNIWAAIPRSLVQKYFNDLETPGVLFSRELDTLADLICRTNGDEESIDALLKIQ